MYVLKYAHSMLGMCQQPVTREDIDDNFRNAISDNDMFDFSHKDIERMRLDCVVGPRGVCRSVHFICHAPWVVLCLDFCPAASALEY